MPNATQVFANEFIFAKAKFFAYIIYGLNLTWTKNARKVQISLLALTQTKNFFTYAS